MIDWLFRNRHTGQTTIAQFPNLPLWLFLAATALRWLFDPSGDLRTAIQAVATIGLLWWATDELLRGVNPWRRLLGAAILAAEAAKYLH